VLQLRDNDVIIISLNDHVPSPSKSYVSIDNPNEITLKQAIGFGAVSLYFLIIGIELII
jgi:hypothetical protein